MKGLFSHRMVFFFCRCLLFPAAPPSGQTDRRLFCSGLLDRAQTDSSVLMCNLLLFSSCLISVHTVTSTMLQLIGTRQEAVGCWQPWAAVSSSRFFFFFVKASYSGGRLAPKWHFCGSLSSWKLFFQRGSWLLFFYSPCQSQQSVKKLSHMMLRPSHILSSPDSSLSLLQDTCLCGFTAHFLFSSLSVVCILQPRPITACLYQSVLLEWSSQELKHTLTDCTGRLYDRLYVRCLHVCCWDVWRVLVGGTTGGEMTVNQ